MKILLHALFGTLLAASVVTAVYALGLAIREIVKEYRQ